MNGGRASLTHGTDPTRIAFCITDLDPGGAERALFQLVTRLDRSRWHPAVFGLAPEGSLAADLRAAGIAVECLGAKNARSLGVIWKLASSLKQFKPALLQTFLFHANLAGRFAAKLAGVPRVFSGIRVAEKRSAIPLWLDRWTNFLVDKNICVSQAVAHFTETRAGIARRKITVIPNGVDVDRFANASRADLSQFGIPNGSRTLVTVGRLDRQKGLSSLLEAAQTIIPQFDNLHFLLVGEGPERSMLESQIKERGVVNRVHLAGWRPDVPAIMKGATALVLSSLWEGMPNVVLEAMAAGLPVIATQVEGIDELVLPEITGNTVPSNSPTDLAAAIAKLLQDPPRAQSFGAAGQERARQEFSWERMASRYEEVYLDSLGNVARALDNQF